MDKELKKRKMKNILVVDDESIIALSLEEDIKELGYKTAGIVASGEKAIEIAREHRPDLILMDIAMPGEKDGIDAAAEITAELDIPIVFMTAYADEELIKRAKFVKPSGYILKPYDKREVRAVIEMALCKKEMEGKLIRAYDELGKRITEHTAELKTTNEQLTYERYRAEFLIDLLRHDIHNLNQGIFSGLERLLAQPEFPEQFKDCVKTAFKQSERLTKLTKNAHILSKVQKRGLALKPINIVPLLTRAIRQVNKNRFHKEQELEISYHFAENVVEVRGNELLEAVFYIILENAVKHSRQDTVRVDVTVRAAENGNDWTIEFKDRGPGVPDELKETIFSRMEHSDRKEFATGLGLTLVKEIVGECKGTVRVEDRIKGDRTKGSNFIVALPKG
jgi:signal transduction histidine kinase